MTESLQEIERLMIDYGLECYSEGKTQLMADTKVKGEALMSAITSVVQERDRSTKELVGYSKQGIVDMDRISALEKALREARQVLIVACGDKAPYVRIALTHIDAALAAGGEDG